MRHFNLSEDRATQLYIQSGFGKRTQVGTRHPSNSISLKKRKISMSSEEEDELMGDDDLNAELRKQAQSRESVIPTAVRSLTPTPFLQERHGNEVGSERLMQKSNKEKQHDETQMPSDFGSCGSTDVNSLEYHLLQEQYNQQRRITSLNLF